MNATRKLSFLTPQILCLFAAARLLAAEPVDSFAEQPVLTVNQHAVSRDEFRWFMEQERAPVFQYFKTHYNLEDGKDFWTHPCDGTSPREMLRTNTLSRIAREKSEQILFLELGLVQEIRYSSFVEDLNKLNQAREQSAKEGKTIYGPVRYTQSQFYGHWKANLQIQAMEKLGLRRAGATGKETSAAYERLLAERVKQAQVRTNDKVIASLLPGPPTD